MRPHLDPSAKRCLDRELNCSVVMEPRFFSMRVTNASSGLPAAILAGSQRFTTPLDMPPATRPIGRAPLCSPTAPQSKEEKRELRRDNSSEDHNHEYTKNHGVSWRKKRVESSHSPGTHPVFISHSTLMSVPGV